MTFYVAHVFPNSVCDLRTVWNLGWFYAA